MGRPPSPWLERAYQLLADGQWRSRDQLLVEMVKAVPPGVAHRRGRSQTDRALSDSELIRRGARHICLVSLTESKSLLRTTRDGTMLFRLDVPEAEVAAAPQPSALVTETDGLPWASLVALAVAAAEHEHDLLERLPMGPRLRERLITAVEEGLQ